MPIPDKVVEVAVKQLEAGLLFKQPRMDRIKAIEEMYLLKEKPALVGQYNVPFDGVVMRGYIGTLNSKIDEPPELEFKNDEKESALKACKKLSAAWRVDSGPEHGDWARHDRVGKFLASISGRAIFLDYGEADPDFEFHIDNIDHYDFVPEPNGGAFIKDHLFNYQLNHFRTRKQLTEGDYDKDQVQKLINATSDNDFKETNDTYKNKQSRFAALSLNAENNNYTGEPLFNLTRGPMIWKGEMYWLEFDYKSRTGVRFEKLKKRFKSNLNPFVSWATEDDPFNFWSLGPADTVFPVAEARRINLNAMLNNARRRADEMTAFDPTVITDPSQLIYRPDGLIAMNLKGQDIRANILKLSPPDITALAQNLDTFLDNLLGEKTGITAATQGNADEKRVGIYEGNLQQAADRLGLMNKMYVAANREHGIRYDWAAYEHMPEKRMVKMIGLKGAEWDEITKEDLDHDFTVHVVDRRSEMEASTIKAEKQAAALDRVFTSPNQQFIAQYNPKWLAEQNLRQGGWDDEAIRVAMDVQNYGKQEELADAAKAIEHCLAGKPSKKYRGATTAFVQKILDFAYDSESLKDEEFYKLLALAEAHIEIATENMARKAAMVVAQSGGMQPNPNAPAPATPTGAPMDQQQPAPSLPATATQPTA